MKEIPIRDKKGYLTLFGELVKSEIIEPSYEKGDSIRIMYSTYFDISGDFIENSPDQARKMIIEQLRLLSEITRKDINGVVDGLIINSPKE